MNPEQTISDIVAQRTQPRDPEFKRGSGTPDQLPKGEAQSLNEAVIPSSPQAPAGGGVVSAGQAPAGPGPQVPDYKPVPGSTEDFLFGPTNRPDEPVTFGAYGGQAPPPPQVLGILPILNDLANDPTAPQQVRDLRSLLIRSMYTGGNA